MLDFSERDLPQFQALGREAIHQTRLLQRTRQGRPLRRLRAARDVFEGSARLLPQDPIAQLSLRRIPALGESAFIILDHIEGRRSPMAANGFCSDDANLPWQGLAR